MCGPGGPGGAARSPCRSIRRSRPRRRATSCEDSGARVAIVSTRLQLEKMQEVRHQLPALEAVVVMDAAAAERQPVGPRARRRSRERGHARMTGEWGAGREFRDGARAVTPERARDHHLHLGHDRRAEGRDADARQPRRRTCMAGAEVLDVCAGRRRAVVPAAQPRVRADGRRTSTCSAACTIVFAESFDTIGRDLARVRPTVLTGVPRVYEKLQARIMEKGQAQPAAEARDLSAGRSAPASRGRARRCAGSAPGRSTSLQAALADRLVFAKIRDGARRPAPVSSSRAARRCRSSVAEFFHGIGLPIIEGYGLTETSPILTVNPPDAPRVGTVGRAAARRRAADRRGRRDPRARPERHDRLLQQAARRPPTRCRTAGSTPATSARSTPTATWRSPIARRTCSSPRAARRSRRSRSKRCSSAARSSPKRCSSAIAASSPPR